MLPARVNGFSWRGCLASARSKGVSLSEADAYAPFQSDLAVYHDDLQDYSGNESTMDGAVSAILMWALF
jgi:hypothetical protein